MLYEAWRFQISILSQIHQGSDFCIKMPENRIILLELSEIGFWDPWALYSNAMYLVSLDPVSPYPKKFETLREGKGRNNDAVH